MEPGSGAGIKIILRILMLKLIKKRQFVKENLYLRRKLIKNNLFEIMLKIIDRPGSNLLILFRNDGFQAF